MREPDNDWELLNAFADGELSTAQSAELTARLDTEPDLRLELDRLRHLKWQLSSLHPGDIGATSILKPRKSTRSRTFAGAIAVVLLVIATGIGALLAWPPAQATWFDQAMSLHEQLSQMTFVVDEEYTTRLVSSGETLEFRAPDLTASRLYLVDVVTSPSDEADAIAMHYRGLNGCRLTVVAIPDAHAIYEPPVTEGSAYTWSFEGYDFAVIAQGMDAQRFASVAAYLEAAIMDDVRRHDDLQVAMADRYAAAMPCA